MPQAPLCRNLFPVCPSAPAKVTWRSPNGTPVFFIMRSLSSDTSRAAGNAAESVAMNVQPRRTGQVLIGSSRQFSSESSGIEAPILRRMLCRAIEYLPGLARLTVVRTWTGFRTASDDNLPLIGPWPPLAGLYLAAGHEGLGISMALGTAELLMDMLIGRKSSIPREPYLPERFVKSL